MIGVDLNLRLPDLFAAVFGIRDYEVLPENESGRESYVGTPVLALITFEGGRYNVYEKGGGIKQEKYNDFELPAATLVSIRRAKRIVTTPVAAGSGSVKELFGFDDWQIDINGFCIPDPNQPQGFTSADAQMAELQRWEKIADAIRIKGGLPIHKEIHNMVIREFSTWQLKGSPEVIPFRISAISDEPVELLLT